MFRYLSPHFVLFALFNSQNRVTRKYHQVLIELYTIVQMKLLPCISQAKISIVLTEVHKYDNVQV